MRETRQVMGMPVTIELVDAKATHDEVEKIYAYFKYVDETFSTYKATSEISQINAGHHPKNSWSADMRYVFEQSELTRQETGGYFSIQHYGHIDPSGYVKGWAIQNAAQMVTEDGIENYYIEVGGDLQVSGLNSTNLPWTVGIRNPFNELEIIKRVSLHNLGMATSGTYIRGQHIYNPLLPSTPLLDIVSLTVIGPRIVDADRFATAAFAMGKDGINFIAGLKDLEGYMIDNQGMATFTDGFSQLILR